MLRTLTVFFVVTFIHTGLFAQQGILKGIIVNEKGTILPGATIRLEPDRHLKQADAKGAFVFRGLYEGTYTMYVSNVGFITDTQEVAIQAGVTTAVVIRLKPGVGEMQEVIVAADIKSYTPDNLLNIQQSAMPVTVITRETIERMGSRRLDELLKEQTGLAVVSDISGGARATGIQMQGFGSEYVMVLIDGQPMVGRNSGNFDLSRISITNIERIEIIKGASSCLFGSEALGGAINIVTRYGAIQPQAQASLQYGSLNIVDATLEGETPFAHKRGSANLSANYYHSDGFNTDKQYISQGTTAPPYDDYSVQGRARYRLSKNGTVGMTGRYALRRSFMSKIFTGSGGGQANTSGDNQDVTDINLSGYYNHNFNNGLRSMSRYYFTRYVSDMSVLWQQGSTASAEQFAQTLHRFEQQFAYAPWQAVKLTGGLGGSLEMMDNNAYTHAADMTAGFAYLQANWLLHSTTELTGGLRYDRHNNYGGRFNPSLGLQQKITSWLTGKLAAGTGFKTPDFKNRYQVFLNPLSNYMVVGTEVLGETLKQLEAAGQISEIRQHLLQQLDGNLQAEKSTSLNMSLLFKLNNTFKLEAGVFYHDIRNQINSIQVATGSNNRQIFTYQNLPKSVNKGVEASCSWTPITGLEINGGYQYLIAKDRSVEVSIRAANWPWNKVRNNETGETRSSIPSDYWGIENRSRHMANLRVFYSWRAAGINASFRVNYRGKYPFGDANNNAFIDRYDTFVEGFFLLNASIEKRLLKDHLSLRITADNITDYTDRLMPAQPGRIVLLGAVYRWHMD
ncbi:TonB-dependent receptor [Paraflavitalea devenefica]|uniref:TonB-dependent receptor n=1 Tax=Paraflavitalea devenefica TaxID=2716334 RepID=UPI001ABA5DAB|nr:TonB-dependent receptor [Paraflavitalea devenefica]